MLAQGREVQTHRASGVRDEEPIVFVVDDDLSMREALEALIEAAGRRVLTFASGEEFLGHIQERRPSCLLLDYTLPDLNGLQIQQRIAAERPDMSIIFVTGNGSVPITVKAMRAGAVEFLTKPFKSDELLRAIEVALQRSQAELRQAARARVFEARFTSLSGRERQVMGLVLRGLLNKQIGGELGISLITVKAHRGRMMKKMRVASLAELVQLSAEFHPEVTSGGETLLQDRVATALGGHR
jgi:FixJ family two-component response regulator